MTRLDIKTIPIGSWEENNIRCPPASNKNSREYFADIFYEEHGGRYNNGQSITATRNELKKRMRVYRKR